VEKMAKLILITCAAVAVLFAVLYMIPVKSCDVQWLDRDLTPIEGPFGECPAKLDTREVGERRFARIGGNVYRLTEQITTEKAGFPCMTGVACFPIPSRAREWKRLEFIKLDGLVDIDKLQAYYGGRYLSDGKAQFYGWLPITELTPPLDLARLRDVDPRTSEEYPPSAYVTDGRWVLHNEKVVPGADPATFRTMVARTLKGRAIASESFARDRHAVFLQASKIDGADPATFGVVVYGGDEKPDSVNAGGGWIATDRSGAWVITVGEARRLDVTPVQLGALRADVTRASAAVRQR
jgi:hypothetical protein